ncbi:AlpA family phage regulatory protein [Alcaligenaceae bacterium]|nr:AlpA family phage regulatory protein [Alcaligenaceae bacterium]
MNQLHTANVVAINRKELLSKIPLSDRTIFDMEKRGEFPQRFCLSNRVVAWDLAEVDAWIEARKSARENTQMPAPHIGLRRYAGQ